jgi:CRISPR-associated protein Csx17
MIVHKLDGCAPTPLAHYLKALGVLRLVSEQADPDARGWWKEERFLLATHLDENQLIRFFLERYEPTPLVAPWNKGSGFFNSNDRGLTPVEQSSARRFEKLREGIEASRAMLGELAAADQIVRDIKAETKHKALSRAQKEALRASVDYKKRLTEANKRFKQLKAEFIPRLRLTWRGPHRQWLDVAMVLDELGQPHFPALLGTGGNDGRLDFTNNYFQRIGEIFDLRNSRGLAMPESEDWFSNALFGRPINTFQGGAIGQYAPGATGGANSSVGVDGHGLINPVDFVLMLEGAVLFTAHATRRFDSVAPSRAAAPFVVGAQGAGYASANENDESARGEQWMPLWSRPTTLHELQRLLAEGRAQIGRKPAHEPIDMARAIARLGAARGISAFQRYGYIERNGQANLAVPLGRFRVPDHSSSRLACLDDLEAWLTKLRRAARDTGAPSRLKIAERRLSDTVFEIIQSPDERPRWQVLVSALADVEAILLTGGTPRCGPIPPLRPEWVRAADDGSAEWRLAVALALQASDFSRNDLTPIDRVRRHWVPVKNGETAVVMQGRRGIDDAIALIERRLIEATQAGLRRLPLIAAPKAHASLADLAAVTAGEVDLDRTLACARVLMAIDGRDWARCPQILPPSSGAARWPDEGWQVIRLAMLPWPLPDGRSIGFDPAILRRLETGDGATAIELAARRLRAAGIRPTIRAGTVSPEAARHWAAALAFPIHPATATRIARQIGSESISESQGA